MITDMFLMMLLEIKILECIFPPHNNYDFVLDFEPGLQDLR